MGLLDLALLAPEGRWVGTEPPEVVRRVPVGAEARSQPWHQLAALTADARPGAQVPQLQSLLPEVADHPDRSPEKLPDCCLGEPFR